MAQNFNFCMDNNLDLYQIQKYFGFCLLGCQSFDLDLEHYDSLTIAPPLLIVTTLIATTHPSEIVMQLQIGRVARGLRHRPDDTWQLRCAATAQQTGEHVAQCGRMVQII
jgi:hypothetical protein